MTASYEIISSEHLKYVRILGTTNYEELRELFFKYIRDPEFNPDFRILADLREMTDAIAGLWEIQKLKRLYQYAYNDRIAVVDVVIVVNKGIAYRAARAFQMFMRDKGPLVIRVTDSMLEAQSMLGLRDDTIARLVTHQ